MLHKDLRDVLLAFNAHKVRYLVVGGYAFGVHAEPRATNDLDLFIRTDAANCRAAFEALAEFGAPLAGMTFADFSDGTTFQMGQPPARVDIIQRIDGVTFDQAWENRVEGEIDGDIPATVISREDLIQNKLAVGRLQDLADVEALRAAERAAKGTSK